MLSTVLKPFSATKAFFWGKPPADKKEAKLLFKIDCFVLSYVCLNYWVNYLDRSNLANAYVSGMQEDLNMKGDEYNIINTVFTVGYIVGMIPNNIMLLKVQPRYWLTFCSFSWGLLTLGLYKVHSYQQICAIRFFQAYFESSTFSGSHLILGSWYNSEDIVDPETGKVSASELTKRSAVFTSSGLIGSLFSSFMQAAIFQNMDGYNGLEGWRWLFIIDFIITVPICIFGFLCFPDTPDTCKAFYFSKEEIELAKSRVKNPKMEAAWGWGIIKRVIGRWHWYLLSLLWVFGGENESFCSNSLFALWLKKFNYTVEQRNHYPMGIYGVGIAATFFSALYVDHTGGRYHWHIAILIGVALLVSTIMILARPHSTGVMFAAQYIAGISFAGQATFFSWANLICRDDLQERAIVLASMNMFSGAVNAWWSILFYAATTVPEFKKGSYAMIATTVVSMILACAIRFLQLRDEKQKRLNQNIPVGEEDLEKSSFNGEAGVIESHKEGYVVNEKQRDLSISE